MKYLAIGSSPKTIKSDKEGEYLTAIMYLSPADIAYKALNMKGTLCAMADTAGCKLGCLNTSGRGAMNSIQQARLRKTIAFIKDPVSFVDQLKDDIAKGIKKADKAGVKLAVRLNGTSDIPWENMKGSNGRTLMEEYHSIQFYDYTKLPNRKVPSNYHLTVSYSGANDAYATKALKTNHNIAVVFRDKELPATFKGRKVIDGDKTDLRFLDPKKVVVGLYAKGKARKDDTGFVIDTNIIARG